MDNENTLIIFGLAFLVLAAVAVGVGQADPLTVATSQAQGNLLIGTRASMTFDVIFTMVWKGIILLLLGGVVWFVFAYGPKLYRQWEKRNTANWKSGSYAYWGKEPRGQHFTKNDLMYWGSLMREGIRPGMFQASSPQADDDAEVLL